MTRFPCTLFQIHSILLVFAALKFFGQLLFPWNESYLLTFTMVYEQTQTKACSENYSHSVGSNERKGLSMVDCNKLSTLLK